MSRHFRSQLTPLLLDEVERRGGDAAAIIRRFGLPADAARLPEVTLPLETFWELSDVCSQAARDPHLGLHVGSRLLPGNYGALEYAAKSASTLGDALELLVGFSASLNSLTVFALERSGATARLTHAIPGEPRCVGRHGNEYALAGLVFIGKALIGPMQLDRAWFATPRPDDDRALRDYFAGIELSYGAGSNGIAFPSALLSQPVKSADPKLAALLEREVLSRVDRGSDLLADLRRRVAEALPKRAFELEQLAKALHLTPRTLQRRIAEHRTTYAALVDSVREAIARERVLDQSVPLAQLAYDLGYSDLPTFVRAFKRWTKQTPGAYRSERA